MLVIEGHTVTRVILMWVAGATGTIVMPVAAVRVMSRSIFLLQQGSVLRPVLPQGVIETMSVEIKGPC